MKRTLSIAAVVGGLLVAAPAAHAAPAAVTVTSNGKAIALSTPSPVAGATSFTFRYTKAKGFSSPALVRLGPGVDPGAVLAAVRKLGNDQGPEKLLKRFGASLLTSTDEIHKGDVRTLTVALTPGPYLLLDTAKPRKAIGTGFTVVPATGPMEPLPAARAVTLSDFHVKAPKRVAAGAAWAVTNRGPSLHFLLAIGVPKGLTNKAAIKAIRANDDKPFVKSPFAEVIGLVSPGATTVLDPGLKRGRWVLVCFYANAKSHQRPHSMLGMETVVSVK